MADHSEPVPPRIIATQGYTPDCGEDRSVIFVVNLLSLFFGNRDGARLLENEISCVDSYGGRLLPILGIIFRGGRNVIVLERKPDPALTDFFRSLGLKLPEIEILTRPEFLALGTQLEQNTPRAHPLLDRLRKHPTDTLDGYVTDETIARLAASLGKRTLSTPEGSHRGNNKLLLHQHLELSGLPVFPTRLAASVSEITAALQEFRAHGYHAAVVKSQIGATGIGLIKLPTDTAGPEIPNAFFYEGPCMVQAWLQPGEHGITAVLSPSVQLFLHDDAAYLYDLTEQILDADSTHQGNESPPPYLPQLPGLQSEIYRQAADAATWLHRQGYRGAASADFLITRHGGESFTAYICEINARVTGATYPSVLARHFHPHGAWLMHNLELATPLPGDVLLDKLRTHGELFDPARRTGILPINFNLGPDGLVRKGQFLAIADELPDCRRLLNTGRQDLPIAWTYTRDR
jgi:hypothetical protein